MFAAASDPFHTLLCFALTAYFIILLAWVVLSWAQFAGFRPGSLTGPGRKAFELLDDVTRPVLSPLARIIHPIRFGTVGLDLSAIVAFIIIAVLRAALHC